MLGRYRTIALRLGILSAAFLICATLLIVLYARPYLARLDIGKSTLHVSGMHNTETNDTLSFAYSRGDAAVWFPRVGDGTFAVRVRMGGPGAVETVAARFQSPAQSLTLGKVTEFRTYDILMPSDGYGNANFHLLSDTRQLGDDPRQLGLLLDRLDLRSFGGTTPPLVAFLVALIPLLVVGTLYHVFPASFRTALKFFACWRVGLWLIGLVGLLLSPALFGIGMALSYHGEVVDRSNLVWKTLVDAWSQWDSTHYEAIALGGYTFTEARYPTIAFFPLYPLLIRVFLPVTRGNVNMAALIASHLALVSALVVLLELLRRDFSPRIAVRTLALLLIFPTSLFFGAAYSESLALLLVACSLLAIRAQRWWLAGIAGAALTLTRLPGVTIAVVLLVAYLQERGWRWRTLKPDILAAALPPLALGSFMLFQQLRFGTPFAFMLAQERWDQHLSFPWTMPLVLVQQIGISPEWPVVVFQAFVWLTFLLLTVFTLRRLPLVYALTLVLLLLPPYLSNFPGSIPRYVLMGVPAFVFLAMVGQRPIARRLIVGVSLPLLVLAVLLFVNGFWVA